jgi:predicted permease
MNPVRRLLNLFRRSRLDREMDVEMRAHLERETEQNIARGMPPDEARCAARRAFGGLERIQEEERDARGLVWLENLLRDARLSVRSLARNPGFTATTLFVLTLGTAATAVIFTFANGVFLKPMPFAEPDALVDLNETAPQWNVSRMGIAWPDYEAWRDQNTSFAGMAVLQTGSADLTTETLAERINILRVSHDLTDLLGIQPVLGRGFAAGEDAPGGERVALLGFRAWQKLFGADPNILGRSITINREPHIVVGVLPRAAAYPNNAAIWVPSTNRSPAWCMMGVGRLKPGVTVAAAHAELLRIHGNLASERKENAITSPTVTPLRESQVGAEVQFIGLLISGGALVVLLVACGNVASMMVARGLAHRGETAVRVALGASATRIARPVLIESLLLCTAAGVAGVLAARALLDGYLAWLVLDLPAWVNLEMDLRFALGFIAIVSLASLACALLPIRVAARLCDLREVIAGHTTQTTGSAARFAGLRVLVVAETAFAVALLLVATLLAQAMQGVAAADPGFSARNVIVYELRLNGAAYADAATVQAFHEEHLRRVRALPGVERVSGCTATPLSGMREGSFFEPEGAESPDRTPAQVAIPFRSAMPGYFAVMGIPVVAGRPFTEHDADEGNHVAIIDEALARRFWPDGAAVGKRLRVRGPNSAWIEVIGVVRNVPLESVEKASVPSVYFPFKTEAHARLDVVVQCSGDNATSLLPSIRGIVRSQDSGLVLGAAGTMEQRLENARWLRRFYTTTILLFAGSVLVLVAAGLFGVVSFVVQQRTREIGIRMALGATKRSVIGLVLREAVSLTGIGAAVGVFAGLVLGNVLRGLLFGVNPINPFVLSAALLLLGTVVVAASAGPAWRAMRVNPVDALRAE